MRAILVKKGLKNISIKAHQPLLDARIYIIYKYHDKLIVANLFFLMLYIYLENCTAYTGVL